MFAERGFSIGGRVVAGVLLVATMFVVLHVFFFSDMDYLRASLGLPFLLCLVYLCVRLVPSAYRASRGAYILGGVAVGAGIIGLVGSRCGFELIGAVTGALLGGLIAHGLAAGVVDTVLAGAVVFGALSALIVSYPHSEMFGGTMAVPGGLLGASIVWMCRKARRPGTVSIVLAAAALVGGLSALIGPPYAFWWKMACAGYLAGASILGTCWRPRQPQSAEIAVCASQSLPVIRMGPEDGPRLGRAGTNPFEEPARRRFPGSVRRIMVAVVCCAFLLGGFREDAKGAMEGIAHLLLFVGGPASGVILQRRWGGRGIMGGAIAGAATSFLSTAATFAWFYLNPRMGALPEPLKQIVHSAISGATFGVIVGVLIWGVMRAERGSDSGGEFLLRRGRPLSAPGDDRPMPHPRFQFAVLAAATVYLVEGDLAGTVSDRGYAVILAAWILMLVAIGFDVVRVLNRAATFALGSLRT